MHSHDAVRIKNRAWTSKVDEQRILMLQQEGLKIDLLPKDTGKQPEPDDPALQGVFWPDLFWCKDDKSREPVGQSIAYLV